MKEVYRLTYIGKYDNRRHMFKLVFDSTRYSLSDRLESLAPLGFTDVHVYNSENKLVLKLDKIDYKK